MTTVQNKSRSVARATSFASTATTVVALLAIASAARMVPIGEVLVLHEARPAIRESSVVRAVAVAVAAAKEMLGVDQTTSTFDIAGTSQPVGSRVCSFALPPEDVENAHSTQLGERLLDLPPPTL